MIKPKRLQAGARIAVLSPASTPKEPLVRLGMQRLASLGYQPVLMPSALTAGPLYYAGEAAARAADLHAAFADTTIDAVMCTRGGWGCAELLPLLDAGLIRANPKPFLGFSDPTTLHLWFAQTCGLHTFYAPMVSPDFARGNVLAEGVDLRSWRHALERIDPWSLGEREGMRVLRAGDASEGTLVGGCLALLVESLGTPYAMQPPEGDLILFLEEVGTRAYQWDRMMLHLRYAGVLDRVRGIVFGDMAQCADDAAEVELIEKALLHNLRDFAGPIAIGLQSGHVNQPNVTLPLGVRARLACTSGASLHPGIGGRVEPVDCSATSSKHIHLIGVCGTAMASLAGMLQGQGHRITGSDAAAYPPMSDQLRAMGIEPMQPYNEQHLEPAPDLVVIGNAISRGNPELEAVLDRRLQFTSMAALIHDEFLRGREPLVVTGTHGKTTTTSMLAWIYEVASRTRPELAPSFLIGGVAENFGTSFAVRETRPFLLEGDEYDTAFFDKGPKFLHYFPQAAILTHVEFDHADIYPDLPAVKTAFKRLVNLIPRGGRLVAYDGSANVTECAAKAFCPVERYGFSEDSFWRLTDFQAGALSRWTLLRQGQHFADLELPMAGEHNALNATAAAALAAGQGIDAASIAEALRTFRSVKRRLEVRAEVGGITIIDDFAHHPTAIRETLRALRGAYPGRRLVAVLEPRSNTLRRNVFERELVDSLAVADEVVLAAVYQSNAIPEPERLDADRVVRTLNHSNVPAVMLPDEDAITALLSGTLRSGDVVAILSNGGFGDIYNKLPAALRAR